MESRNSYESKEGGELPKGLKASEQSKWHSVPKDNVKHGNSLNRNQRMFLGWRSYWAVKDRTWAVFLF